MERRTGRQAWGPEERCPSVDKANALSAHAEFRRCDQGRLQVHVLSAALYQKSSIGEAAALLGATASPLGPGADRC